MSARGLDSYGRPMDRHHHTESGFSVQSITSPEGPEHSQGQEQGVTAPIEPRLRSAGLHSVSSLLEQSDSRPHQSQARYSAGPETRHEGQRRTPEGDGSQRGPIGKRDDQAI